MLRFALQQAIVVRDYFIVVGYWLEKECSAEYAVGVHLCLVKVTLGSIEWHFLLVLVA